MYQIIAIIALPCQSVLVWKFAQIVGFVKFTWIPLEVDPWVRPN